MPSSSNHAAKITSRTRVPGQPATVVSGVNEVGEHFETFVPDTEPRDALKTVGGLGVKEINHIAFDSKDIEGSAALWVHRLSY